MVRTVMLGDTVCVHYIESHSVGGCCDGGCCEGRVYVNNVAGGVLVGAVCRDPVILVSAVCNCETTGIKDDR